MRAFGAIVWPFRFLRHSSARTSAPLRDLPELDTVNRLAGSEPIRPALSGLQLRPPDVPGAAMQRRITLAYQWQPSREHRKRQEDVRATNSRLDRRRLSVSPPVLLFPEDTEIVPNRFQVLFGQQEPGHPFVSGKLPLDLEMENRKGQRAQILQPRLPEADPELFLSDRYLLSRSYRRFLRRSPWPRVVAALILGTLLTGGALWLMQLEQAAAVAAGQVAEAQRAVRIELGAARSYGVDPRLLRPLEERAKVLTALPSPSTIVPGRLQIEFYRSQIRHYRVLLRRVRRLERLALRYWTWKERITYAALMEAQHEAATLDLQRHGWTIPSCATPRCFQAAVAGQEGEIRWLRQTVATLRVYGLAVQGAIDPAAAAAAETSLAHNLAAVVSPAGMPVPLSSLDGALATAATVDADARVGALARLDADFLFRRLLASVRGTLIVVDAEDERVTCYQNGKTVYATIATVGAATPSGRFHLDAKQAAIPATYWLHDARGYRYHFGIIPNWMQFSAASALQGAPWRALYGLGTAGPVAGYAPATPGSVDLPPAAASWIFTWAPVGAEVVVV